MKKALMAFFAVLLLVVSSASASFAYFTDKQSVANSFSVGHVGIKLEQYIGDSTEPQKGDVTIDKIVPGQSYAIKPVITVGDDSVDSWLFVRVDNKLTAIEDSAYTIQAQMDAKGWKLLDASKNIYYYNKLVKAGDDITVFESFTVGGATVDTAALEASEDKTISITAYAVQAPGFDTAQAAWTAAVNAGNISL